MAHLLGAIRAYADLAEFQLKQEAARHVSPLDGSYHQVSTVAPFLLDCSGLLPIPSHVIGVSAVQARQRRHRFGAKETQSMLLFKLSRSKG